MKQTPYAPTLKGGFDDDPYNHRRRLGRMAELETGKLLGATHDMNRFLDARLADATASLPAAQPIVVMVHGFLFNPRDATSARPEDSDNPHSRVFHFVDGIEAHEQRHHTTSWPLHLGLVEHDAGSNGLAFAFGWQSQPGFARSLIAHFKNFYARAYEIAGLSSWVLANNLVQLQERFPSNPLHIVCHSLGSRVVIRALAKMAKIARAPATTSTEQAMHERLGNAIEHLQRVVIMGGAEYVVEAQLMQKRLMEGGFQRIPDFYNIVSRENDVLDKLGENFGPRTFGNSQVVGHNGLGLEKQQNYPDNWIDLQIDSSELQAWLSSNHQLEVSGDRPGNIWDHWYYYTYRGNFALYRNILRGGSAWSIGTLRGAKIKEGVRVGRWRID